MKIKKLTIIVPVYNEVKTVGQVIKRLSGLRITGVKTELIVVDDGSNDGTGRLLRQLERHKEKGVKPKYIFKRINAGKGAAVKTALKKATGNYVIIQDADLEYDPAEIGKLVRFAEKGGYEAVYGSRNKDIKNTYLYAHYYWGARLIYALINLLYGQNLTDPETCYKLIKRSKLNFDIQEKGFGLEVELTAKLVKQGIKIQETSITYKPRTFAEGKKIKAKDGLEAIWLAVKYRWG